MPDASTTENEVRELGPPTPDAEVAPDQSQAANTNTTTVWHQIPAPAHATKAKRTRKTASQRKAAKGGRPGNPGTFRGDDSVYLSSLLKDYLNARDVQARGRGKNTKLEAFWGCMIAGFWERFDWTSYAREGETKEETIERINGVSV